MSRPAFNGEREHNFLVGNYLDTIGAEEATDILEQIGWKAYYKPMLPPREGSPRHQQNEACREAIKAVLQIWRMHGERRPLTAREAAIGRAFDLVAIEQAENHAEKYL